MIEKIWVVFLIGWSTVAWDSECEPGAAAWIWSAPRLPQPGEPLKIIAGAVDDELENLLITDPQGRQANLPASTLGGPPWGLFGILQHPPAGEYRLETMRFGQVIACRKVRVGGGEAVQISASWNLATEAFYALWIEHLFAATPEQTLHFPALSPALRNPERNFLYNYLGSVEDQQLKTEPDCADLPYTLRAYFAWKLGLPIASRACSRGSQIAPPHCDAPIIGTINTQVHNSQGEFLELIRRIQDQVHSGSARTALTDEMSDFYPIELTRTTLWPGTIYADPYGHVMILVHWVPQEGEQSGELLAVDAQPDHSVTRKRFWEGTFLFALTPSAGPGFKRFRPLMSNSNSAKIKVLTNQALDGTNGLPAFSIQQARLTSEDFYNKMAKLINPRGLTPEAAYEATLAALIEQLETRVISVDNGVKYINNHLDKIILMPIGAAIFETIGAWEDYATPARDLRLLIAMKVLANLPNRIRKTPDLYNLQGENPDSAATRIEQVHIQNLNEHSITYTRSDGSPWTLTIGDLYARQTALEVAYNPNDCVERRWGATEQTPEFIPCQHRAPREQQIRMEEYRSWFHETTRPQRN